MRVSAGRGPFFAQVPFALLDDPESDAASIATYCALRRFTDFGAESGCRASIATLAKVAGLGRSALKQRLQWLQDAGWIAWTSGKEAGKPSRYIVHASLEGSRLATTPQPPDDHPVVATRPQQRDSNRETSTKTSTPAAWVRPLAEDWATAYGGIPNYGQIGKRLKPLVDAHGFELVREHWRRYLEATEGQYASPERFAQTYGSWDRAGGAPAQEGYVSPEDARVAFRAAGIPDTWAINPDGYPSREALTLAIVARKAKLVGAL